MFGPQAPTTKNYLKMSLIGGQGSEKVSQTCQRKMLKIILLLICALVLIMVQINYKPAPNTYSRVHQNLNKSR